MSKDSGEFTSGFQHIHGLDPSLLTIPIDELLELDTHGTSGEHGLKEQHTWHEFLDRSEEEGWVPEAEDPFRYYLSMGPGRFYRAYEGVGRSAMVAGLALSPDDKNGYKVDHAYSSPDTSLAAAAFSKLLVRKFFDEFSGVPPLLRTSHLTIDTAILDRNRGLGRAVYDFGLVKGPDFVIPMPGVSPFPFEDMSEDNKNEARALIEEKGISGILPYVEEQGEATLTTSEFYRMGAFLGALLEKSEPRPDGKYGRERTTEARDTHDNVIELQNPGLRYTALNVHFLKTIAENDPRLAGLILS